MMQSSKHSGIGIKFEITSPAIEIKKRNHYFEKALVGVKAVEAHEVTSRIDFSTSFTNTLASQQAIEDAFGIEVSKQTKLIRELMIRSEIIHSHMIQVYTRILPSLDEENYLAYIRKHEKEYKKANEAIQKAERLLLVLGKRFPHQINSVVGGILVIPSEDEKKEMIKLLKDVISQLTGTIPSLLKKQQYSLDLIDNYSSLWELESTPYLYGKIKVKDEEAKDARQYYLERKKDYPFVGPISRMNNNKKLLSTSAEKLIKKIGIKFPITNPYSFPLVIAIEAIHCAERNIESLQSTHFEHETRPIFSPKKSVGHSCVESAKGTIYHEYDIDDKGEIINARILSDVEQNEEMIKKSVTKLPFDPDKKTRKQLMQEIEYLLEMFYI